jgi:hypothetical protein
MCGWRTWCEPTSFATTKFWIDSRVDAQICQLFTKEGYMPTLQQKIIESFLEQLGKTEDVSAERIEGLRSLLSKEKMPKADDFVKAFNEPDQGELK